jgi:3-oxoacyl-[acyl-carrier protein] reductase
MTDPTGRDFAGRTVLITGGARGFGLAFAEALTQQGAAVALADIDLATAEKEARRLRSAGHRAIAVACDVSDRGQAHAAAVATTHTFGGIDILINNAGLHLTKYNRPFGEQSEGDLRALFDVNLHGIVNCTLACRPALAASEHAAILNISSMAALASRSPYGVSKLAVRGLTIAFADELAAERIRVNAIAPGLQATENAMADLPAATVDHIVDNVQLIHRVGTVDDIVAAMTYLCSDRASFITGVTLPVTGGALLGI